MPKAAWRRRRGETQVKRRVEKKTNSWSAEGLERKTGRGNDEQCWVP